MAVVKMTPEVRTPLCVYEFHVKEMRNRKKDDGMEPSTSRFRGRSFGIEVDIVDDEYRA
jgi:hypothetical protein